jgi:hypothetical protein
MRMPFFLFFLLPIEDLLGGLLAALKYIVILAELTFKRRRGGFIGLVINTLLALAALQPSHIRLFPPFHLGSMYGGDEVCNGSLVAHAHRQPLTILLAFRVILVRSAFLRVLPLELVRKSNGLVGLGSDWSLELCLQWLPGTFGRGEPGRIGAVGGGPEGRETSSEMHPLVILQVFLRFFYVPTQRLPSRRLLVTPRKIEVGTEGSLGIAPGLLLVEVRPGRTKVVLHVPIIFHPAK